MSTQAMQLAIGLMKSGDFDGARLKVLMYLAWKHDWRSGFAWPAMATIATETGIEERSVRRIMHYLEDRGVIRLNRGNGAGHVTRYEFPALAAAEACVVSDKKGDTISEKGGHSEPERGTAATEKGDRDQAAIRKEKQDQKQDQKQEQGQNHHASGAMKAWLTVKAELKNSAWPPEAFDDWLRPMYFFKELSGGVLLLALPPNNRIVAQARTHRDLIVKGLQRHGYKGFALTAYPSDDVLLTLSTGNDEWADAANRIISGRVRRAEADAASAECRRRMAEANEAAANAGAGWPEKVKAIS